MGFAAELTAVTDRLFDAFGEPAVLTVPGGSPQDVTGIIDEPNEETVPGMPRSAMRERLTQVSVLRSEVATCPPKGSTIVFGALDRSFVVDSLQESTEDEWMLAARETD